MAMNKKEQAAMQAAIDRAETLAALRWTEPVERDIGIPEKGFSEGWDYNTHSQRVWIGWSDRTAHGSGQAPINSRIRNGSQGSRKMFSTKAKALAAMRHEVEKNAASELLKIDRLIAAAKAPEVE
jgi:hypothetical protein